ncbi:MAG: CIA30 family protein [Ahrensia sp.]
MSFISQTISRLATIAFFAAGNGVAAASAGQSMIFDDFTNDPQNWWDYVADTVMGGVSDGTIDFSNDGDKHFVRLRGTVSTDNNGGFIQVRRRFDEAIGDGASTVSLTVRGNGERYYVFLRSRKATRPWHSYRASFIADAEWQEVRLTIAEFEPSRDVLPAHIQPADIIGLGLVAYGADFQADLSVADVKID